MSDPTARVSAFNETSVDADRITAVIKASEPLVIQGLAGIDLATGKMEFLDDVAGNLPVGMVISPADGVEANLTGDGTLNKAVATGNRIVKNVTVTGSSALSDFSKLVYGTDGQTFTLTKPAAGLPCGFVWRWVTSTTCDVFLFSAAQSVMLLAASTGVAAPSLYEKKIFGVYGTNCLINAGATLSTETSYRRYKIISLHAVCHNNDTGTIAGAAIPVTCKINGTATTGGVVTLALADCAAAGKIGVAVNNAVAITAANQVEIGDTITLVVTAGGTSFTADLVGSFQFHAIIQPN